MNEFYIEDKFETVIKELGKFAGWKRVWFPTYRCSLIWMNYVNVKFDRIELPIINHFKAAKHFSNKAYLSYHLQTSGFSNFVPKTWSSAYEDLTCLIGMVVCDRLYTLVTEVVKDSSRSQISAWVEEIEELKRIIDLLILRDPIWSAASDDSFTIKTILSYFDIIIKGNDSSAENDAVNDINNIVEIRTGWRKWTGRNNIWIIKPVGMSCGQQIEIRNSLLSIIEVLKTMNYKCIVQKYIERPLLLRNNRKFDIRQWVLVTSMNPVVIYGFSECYLRLSNTEYSLNGDDLSNKFIHLCNNSIQKTFETEIDKEIVDGESRSHSRNDQIPDLYECFTMMTQTEFNTTLEKTLTEHPELQAKCNMTHQYSSYAALDINHRFPSKSDTPFTRIILPQIKSIVINTVLSMRDRVVKVGRGFEWLGVDLMVTEDLEVLLIEVNMSPDISLSTPITSRLVPAAVSDLLALLLNENAADVGFVAAGSTVASLVDGSENNTSDVCDVTMGVDERKETSDNTKGSPFTVPRYDRSRQCDGCTNESEASTTEEISTPHWELWFVSKVFSEVELREFRAMKDSKHILGDDYKPRKLEVLEEIVGILNGETSNSATESSNQPQEQSTQSLEDDPDEI